MGSGGDDQFTDFLGLTFCLTKCFDFERAKVGPLDGARVSVFSVFLSATAHGFNAVRAGA